jgi:hypothetical protein
LRHPEQDRGDRDCRVRDANRSAFSTFQQSAGPADRAFSGIALMF